MAVGLGVLWSGPLHAQQPPLVDASGQVREEAYDHLRRTLLGADQVYEPIAGRRLKGWLNERVAISRQSRDDGNRYWGRISGTKYEAMTADWTETQFRHLGLEDIRRQPFELRPQWFPTDWSLTATGGGQTLSFVSANPATRSRSFPNGIEAEAVWVGLGTAADFAGRDVAGKAVIIQTMLAPGQMGNSASWEGATKRAQDEGAALIVGIWGYGGNFAVWQSTNAFQMVRDPDGTSRYVSESVTTPGFFMGFEDGRTLRDLVGTGQPVTISARVETEMREGLTSVSVYGTLPGTTDETIYVMAHMDGYYDAALDNASGMAVMIGLAEYFAQTPLAERRRSITFIGTAGHHVGSPNAPYLRDQGGAREDRPDDQLRAHRAHPVRCLQHGAAADQYRDTASLVGARQPAAARPDSRCLPHVRCQRHRRDGRPRDWRDDGDRQGGAVGAAHSFAGAQAHRWRHSGLVPAVGLEAVARAFAKIIDEVNTLDLAALQAAPMRSSR